MDQTCVLTDTFWDSHNNLEKHDTWKAKFKSAKDSASIALAHKNTSKVLAIIFSRLYTLRNQILHGGTTWNSSVNRDQMRDCTTFLRALIPALIEIKVFLPS